jgi:hypothetical protein
MTKSIGLSETFKPRTDRLIAPVCNVSSVHVPVNPVSGMVMGWFVMVPVTFPAVSVNVPVIVPTALITPFANVKLVVVSVPVKVPTPGITCMIAVVRPPPAGCCAAAGVDMMARGAAKAKAASGEKNLLLANKRFLLLISKLM